MATSASADVASTRLRKRAGVVGVDLAVVVLLVFLGYVGLTGAAHADRPFGSGVPPVLFGLPPSPLPAGGYERVTAAALAASQPQGELFRAAVRYLPASEASRSPFEVSVHPISRSAWAAVALGPDGFCYATLTVADGGGEGPARTYYARLSRGTPCRGSAATLRSVAVRHLLRAP